MGFIVAAQATSGVGAKTGKVPDPGNREQLTASFEMLLLKGILL